MSESLVGRAVASTRQNAGSVIAVCAPGGVNGPAVTRSADLIVTFGIVSAARLAQVVPVDAAGITTRWRAVSARRQTLRQDDGSWNGLLARDYTQATARIIRRLEVA